MRVDNEVLGGQLKTLENQQNQYLSTFLPIYARLDGKAFSKFTKGMQRPFDHTLNVLILDEICKELLETTNASLIYRQSDEISIFWDRKDNLDFSGRKDKWVGELAGLTSTLMMKYTCKYFPEKVDKNPRFDCRILNVDNNTAADFFMWRQNDCIKNSVSQMSSAYFSHKSLLGVSTNQRKVMLNDIGKPWDDLKDRYKFGVFFRKVPTLCDIDPQYQQYNESTQTMRNLPMSYVYSRIQNFDDKLELLSVDDSMKYVLSVE